MPADENRAGGSAQGAPYDRPGYQQIDPRVLTDDRGNEDLLVFEKTWGHRLLAGVGVVMLVVAFVLVVYCVTQLVSVSSLAGIADFIVTVGYVLYGTGLVAGTLLVPPAIVAIYVAKHPKHALVAVVLAIIALVLVVVFIGLAFVASSASALTILLYAVLLAVLPVIYLIAALKVQRSNKPAAMPDVRF